MSVFDLLNHLFNFAAPALFVALLLAVVSRIFKRGRPLAQTLWAQAAINFAAGVAVLLTGLVYFGRDGMMATYAALVFVCASVQWILAGSWRR